MRSRASWKGHGGVNLHTEYIVNINVYTTYTLPYGILALTLSITPFPLVRIIV
jgi:hypothetical protein